MAATRSGAPDSEQVEKDRRFWDEKAPRYDRLMDRIERFVFVSRPWPKRGFMSSAMTLRRALRETLVLESNPWS
jgi:hypothetical protein